MLAQRISSINSLSALCEKTAANIDELSKAIGMDHRIGPHFLKASVGFGGSCFPKDVKALISHGKTIGEKMTLLKSVIDINNEQPKRVLNLLYKHYQILEEKKITILETSRFFGQAKIVGENLGSIDNSSREKTFVGVGDESIVDPVLNYIPKKLTDLNITIHSKNHIKEIRFLISKIFDAQLVQNYTLEDLYKQLSLSIFFNKLG